MLERKDVITLGGFFLAFLGIFLGFFLQLFGVISRQAMTAMIFGCLAVALVGSLALNRLTGRRRR